MILVHVGQVRNTKTVVEKTHKINTFRKYSIKKISKKCPLDTNGPQVKNFVDRVKLLDIYKELTKVSSFFVS